MDIGRQQVISVTLTLKKSCISQIFIKHKSCDLNKCKFFKLFHWSIISIHRCANIMCNVFLQTKHTDITSTLTKKQNIPLPQKPSFPHQNLYPDFEQDHFYLLFTLYICFLFCLTSFCPTLCLGVHSQCSFSLLYGILVLFAYSTLMGIWVLSYVLLQIVLLQENLNMPLSDQIDIQIYVAYIPRSRISGPQ